MRIFGRIPQGNWASVEIMPHFLPLSPRKLKVVNMSASLLALRKSDLQSVPIFLSSNLSGRDKTSKKEPRNERKSQNSAHILSSQCYIEDKAQQA
jgi:hypothetical protein